MRFPKNMLKTGLFGSLLCLAALTPSCTNDDIPSDSYYTFTGQTVGQYLTAHAEDYSDFVQLLNRSYVSDAGNGSTLMEMLNAYGYYTCFAPTDSAMAREQRRIEREIADFERSLYGSDLQETDSTAVQAQDRKKGRTAAKTRKTRQGDDAQGVSKRESTSVKASVRRERR